MKQTEQAHRQWHAGIEHVLRASDNVAASEECSGQVNRVDSLKEKQAARLPGENERALQPQTDPDEDVPKVTEEKKILQPVLPPVDWNPSDQPDGPENLEPERQPHGGLLYASASTITSVLVQK